MIMLFTNQNFFASRGWLKNMKSLVSALYILFGLLIVTLTYFNQFAGPILLRNIGWILSIVGILYLFSSFYSSSFHSVKDLFNTEEEEKK